MVYATVKTVSGFDTIEISALSLKTGKTVFTRANAGSESRALQVLAVSVNEDRTMVAVAALGLVDGAWVYETRILDASEKVDEVVRESGRLAVSDKAYTVNASTRQVGCNYESKNFWASDLESAVAAAEVLKTALWFDVRFYAPKSNKGTKVVEGNVAPFANLGFKPWAWRITAK